MSISVTDPDPITVPRGHSIYGGRGRPLPLPSPRVCPFPRSQHFHPPPTLDPSLPSLVLVCRPVSVPVSVSLDRLTSNVPVYASLLPGPGLISRRRRGPWVDPTGTLDHRPPALLGTGLHYRDSPGPDLSGGEWTGLDSVLVTTPPTVQPPRPGLSSPPDPRSWDSGPGLGEVGTHRVVGKGRNGSGEGDVP